MSTHDKLWYVLDNGSSINSIPVAPCFNFVLEIVSVRSYGFSFVKPKRGRRVTVLILAVKVCVVALVTLVSGVVRP